MTKLERLERLTPREKIKHWAGEKPWAGVRLKHDVEFGINSVLMDGDWNITRQPPTVGKPCFGQPTAFARHGGAAAA